MKSFVIVLCFIGVVSCDLNFHGLQGKTKVRY
jgi:hypothetical protein